jgi:hypothetical protein
MLSRRAWLKRASRLAAGVPLSTFALAKMCAAAAGASALFSRRDGFPRSSSAQLIPGDPTKYRFTKEEDDFLEEVERASFQYFWEAVNPQTGLVKDRCQSNGPDARKVASIAAVGFGLSALCIADHRHWQEAKLIRERVRDTLRFAATRLYHLNGFFFHFLNMDTGDREFHSEVSDIDTSLFLCGVLLCRAYFDDPEIRELAEQLYKRVNWNWFFNGGKTLSMGWTPEKGYIKARWDSYSELMMIYLLGLGSPTHPLPPESWDAWKRPDFEFHGQHYIGSNAPLFIHQYSHTWFDFRGVRDKYADYFTNSIIATKVHKLWCLELAKRFPDYSENLWGISASDSARGYQAWGGPPPMGTIDGSIVPCAAGGSLPFLPQETVAVLRNIRQSYGKQAWQRYGFVDAFNPLTNWYDPDVLGIDAGITLLMAENARTGFVWEYFMKNEEVKTGMARAGFSAIPPVTPQK